MPSPLLRAKAASFPLLLGDQDEIFVKDSEILSSLSPNLGFWLLCPVGNKKHAPLEPILQSGRLRPRNTLSQSNKPPIAPSSLLSTLSEAQVQSPLLGSATLSHEALTWVPGVNMRGLGPELLNHKARQVPALYGISCNFPG